MVLKVFPRTVNYYHYSLAALMNFLFAKKIIKVQISCSTMFLLYNVIINKQTFLILSHLSNI